MNDKSFGIVAECPHCKGEVQFCVTVASEAMYVDQVPLYKRPREERFSSYEVSLLTQCDERGLIRCFAAAVRQAKGSQTPKDIDTFFLTFLRTCQAVQVPKPTLAVLMEEYPMQRIEVYATQGVCLVLADRAPVLFAPDVYARTSNTQKEKRGIQLAAPVGQLSDWIRTRNGYVATRGLLWQELKGKSAGAFARPSL